MGLNNGEIHTDSASIIMLVSLTVMTFGLFIPFWFILKKGSLNSLQSGEKIGVSVSVFVLIISAIGLVIRLAPFFPSLSWIAGYQISQTLPKLFDAVAFLLITAQCFKVKRVLSDHFSTYDKWNKPFSNIATIAFQIFYLQYKINRFNEHELINKKLNEIRREVVG